MVQKWRGGHREGGGSSVVWRWWGEQKGKVVGILPVLWLWLSFIVFVVISSSFYLRCSVSLNSVHCRKRGAPRSELHLRLAGDGGRNAGHDDILCARVATMEFRSCQQTGTRNKAFKDDYIYFLPCNVEKIIRV
ncbi:hypothetical protein DM02DRAFT_398944 [Periconia macrospinosa]|uniref:Uncharacterized protein n=1 Tax=Periconia macrospinosa TaxID=97972 RepID=A0A2V1DQG6_9PLEO|nr:hypothetical protein DM02DRAFT_398944 [Periconia macrospinosa]